MILNRKYYGKSNKLMSLWFKRQVIKLRNDRIFKIFKLFKTEWPNKLYFYSPRLKGKPRYKGTAEVLSQWKESKSCETICPTGAIQVTARAIIIDDRGCIGCGLCVEISPPGLLEMSAEFPFMYRS